MLRASGRPVPIFCTGVALAAPVALATLGACAAAPGVRPGSRLRFNFDAFSSLIFSNFIYELWVGRQIIIPISVSASIAGYVIINGWNAIYSQFLNGTGKIKMQLFFALAGSLVNIPLAVFLGKNLGIYGVILSTTLISLIIAVFSPIQYSKIINNRALGIWAK